MIALVIFALALVSPAVHAMPQLPQGPTVMPAVNAPLGSNGQSTMNSGFVPPCPPCPPNSVPGPPQPVING